MTKETQLVGLSRALKQLQTAERELRRLGTDEIDIVRARIEISEMIRRVSGLVAQKM